MLRFTLDAGILVPGTYVYYDDVLYANWKEYEKRNNATAVAQGLWTGTYNEQRAHAELSLEYGLTWRMLPSNDSLWPKITARRRPWILRPVFVLVACERCGKAAVSTTDAELSLAFH